MLQAKCGVTFHHGPRFAFESFGLGQCALQGPLRKGPPGLHGAIRNGNPKRRLHRHLPATRRPFRALNNIGTDGRAGLSETSALHLNSDLRDRGLALEERTEKNLGPSEAVKSSDRNGLKVPSKTTKTTAQEGLRGPVTDGEVPAKFKDLEAAPESDSDAKEEGFTTEEEEGSEPQRVKEVIMPPHKQVGLMADMSGITITEAMEMDAVYNKELSWLAFNWRVLYLAMNPDTPLFERLRYLAITGRNLDEFFSKRVGALKRQEAVGLNNLISEPGSKTWTPRLQLRYVEKEVEKMKRAQAHILQELLPALSERGIHLLKYNQLTDQQRLQLRDFFKEELEPVITPLAVDPGHPFPYIGNMQLSIAVELRYADEEDGDEDIEFAIVSVPSGVDRWKNICSIDEDCASYAEKNLFVAVEEVIINSLDLLFGEMKVESAYTFRVTRNADIDRKEEEADDLLSMITDELREQKFAPFVRLEVDSQMPEHVVNRLIRKLNISSQDVFKMDPPLALSDLDSIPVRLPMLSNLIYTPWTPFTHPRVCSLASMFDVIKKGDFLVHHPYHSFVTSTLRFVQEASKDPQVVAIKATLYRTNQDSPVVAALKEAAEAGKQVAVLVELKARFDEARNVQFAAELDDAGCHVAYGLVGLKTHCKATMVVRKEEDGLRTYVHIGTGNYNARTAGVYTDLGLFSCDPDLGKDVTDLFKYLTGYHRQKDYRKLLVAPSHMRCKFEALIDREIANAKEGKAASVLVKCNGLDDPKMAEKLYEASMAGVKVDLIVRGMCRVRPKVPGLSENIRVISIIGRFLEHHRIFRFQNVDSPRFYIGSSDWMSRNLTARVEVVVPVESDHIKQELQGVLDGLLIDKKQAWEMQADGSYRLLGSGMPPSPPRPPAPKKRGPVPKTAPVPDLVALAEVNGIQQALMDQVAHQCLTAGNKAKKKKAAVRGRSAKR